MTKGNNRYVTTRLNLGEHFDEAVKVINENNQNWLTYFRNVLQKILEGKTNAIKQKDIEAIEDKNFKRLLSFLSHVETECYEVGRIDGVDTLLRTLQNFFEEERDEGAVTMPLDDWLKTLEKLQEVNNKKARKFPLQVVDTEAFDDLKP